MGVELPRSGVHRRGFIYRALAAVALFVLSISFVPGLASAQEWSAPRTVFVPATGHTSDGLFLDVWRTDRISLAIPSRRSSVPEPRTPVSGKPTSSILRAFGVDLPARG